MKKYKIIYLGDKKICLEKQDNTIFDRVEQCNKLINLIASKDRAFFKYGDNIASFDMASDKKLRYYDEYNNAEITRTHLEDTRKWKGWRNFNGGGTLQNVVR